MIISQRLVGNNPELLQLLYSYISALLASTMQFKVVSALNVCVIAIPWAPAGDLGYAAK